MRLINICRRWSLRQHMMRNGPPRKCCQRRAQAQPACSPEHRRCSSRRPCTCRPRRMATSAGRLWRRRRWGLSALPQRRPKAEGLASRQCPASYPAGQGRVANLFTTVKLYRASGYASVVALQRQCSAALQVPSGCRWRESGHSTFCVARICRARCCVMISASAATVLASADGAAAAAGQAQAESATAHSTAPMARRGQHRTMWCNRMLPRDDCSTFLGRRTVRALLVHAVAGRVSLS